MRQRTAMFTWEDDENNHEFECELQYDVFPAEPDVGIMTGGVAVTGIGDVNGYTYLDGHPAEFSPSKEAGGGWESVVRRRLMAIYEEGGRTADKMNERCHDQEQADYEDAMESRADAERERRSSCH